MRTWRGGVRDAGRAATLWPRGGRRTYNLRSDPGAGRRASPRRVSTLPPEAQGPGSPQGGRPIDRIIAEIVEEHAFLVRRFFERHTEDVLRAGNRLAEAFRGGHRVLFFGNGGSAADAQHLAAELVGRLSPERERAALPAIALTTDTSILTAVANDCGYERVFARQIEALGQRGDVAVAITTSGSSPNVVEGVRTARQLGLTTVGLLGRDGGALRELVDLPLIVEGKRTSRIQEIHILIGHAICQIAEAALLGKRD